jgi:hypothetical protein
LGLRGTGKYCQVVTFYGHLPPLPAGYQAPSGALYKALTGVSGEGVAGGGIKSMTGENDISLRFNILRNFQMPDAGKPNDAGPAVWRVHVSEGGQSDRAMPAPTSDIALPTQLALTGKALSRSRVRNENLHGNLVSAERLSWIYIGDGKDIMPPSMKEPVGHDFHVKQSSFDHPWSQHLH